MLSLQLKIRLLALKNDRVCRNEGWKKKGWRRWVGKKSCHQCINFL